MSRLAYLDLCTAKRRIGPYTAGGRGGKVIGAGLWKTQSKRTNGAF